MGKEHRWTISVDGTEHTVICEKSRLFSHYTLYVDEDIVTVYRRAFQYIRGIDMPITVGGKECRFLVRMEMPDLVVGGMLLTGKIPYEKIQEVPWWCFALMVAMLVPVCFGGVLNIALGVIAYSGVHLIAARPGMGRRRKIRLILLIAAAAWVLFLLLRFLGYPL